MSKETSGYEAFVEKFKTKKTTDDCYTPPAIYNAVLDWVKANANIGDRPIVRLFYPGGDYKSYEYPDNCVVVDNPPFSIFKQIVGYYTTKGIDFFLFGSHLTMMNSMGGHCAVVYGETITYENGAKVNTSFITSLFPDKCVIVDPKLYNAIKNAEKETTFMPRFKVTKSIIWPDCLITMGLLCRIKRVSFSLSKSECSHIKTCGGRDVFGEGFFMNDNATKRFQDAIREAERDKEVITLTLQDKKIIESIGTQESNLFTN